ncbi:BrnA antitoxin family protein [Bradyrhizobium tropiciagri]|uniref:BrnA antitoxin family protein n=1 Tax=Bradyrhizobium tropiciagri TaxID=312253 RepID=UPI00067B2F49|nr:BrnA antitoxin family protein [Bradyrhizobium tropiciagri]
MKREKTIRRRWGDRRSGKSDWTRINALTDAEIEASIENDPDSQDLKDIDWSDAVLAVPPKKKAISIRVDEDVLDFFRSEGEGYQRRINAVLRSYMQQKTKPTKRA